MSPAMEERILGALWAFCAGIWSSAALAQIILGSPILTIITSIFCYLMHCGLVVASIRGAAK